MRQVIRRGADSEEDYTSMSRRQSCVMNVPDIRDGTCKPFSDVKYYCRCILAERSTTRRNLEPLESIQSTVEEKPKGHHLDINSEVRSPPRLIKILPLDGCSSTQSRINLARRFIVGQHLSRFPLTSHRRYIKRKTANGEGYSYRKWTAGWKTTGNRPIPAVSTMGNNGVLDE